jgi:RNA polymerase sigma factor (TIGR02999 family)
MEAPTGPEHHVTAATPHITQLLRAYAAGDPTAFDRVFPLVYEEVKRIARRHLRRAPRGQSLDTTGLVHEVYLKLSAGANVQLEDRGHLLAVTACAMRHIIISRARTRGAVKRGGGQAPVDLDPERLPAQEQAAWLLDLDRALERLREHDERLARIVECRFFAGLSEDETAEAVGVSLRTVQRGWTRARAWLRAELEAPSAPEA